MDALNRIDSVARHLDAFNAADAVVHPVHTQWHYPIVTKYGYVPDTLSAVGFVRKYYYTNPVTNHVIEVTTGVHADHWIDRASGKFGYWAELEPYLASLVSPVPNTGDVR